METAAITKLMADLNIYQIKERLLQYPQKIKDKKTGVRQKYRYLQECQTAKKEYEAEVLAMVCLEKSPNTGKKTFPNDEARKAEMARRLRQDPEYRELLRMLNAAQDEHARVEDELEQLLNEYRSWMFVCEITSNELLLWSNRAQADLKKEIKPAPAVNLATNY